MAPQHGPGGEGDVSALPYRSDLMASLGALLNLWDSPVFHLEVPTAGGEPLDEAAHRMIRHLSFRGPMRPSALAEELGTGRSNISKIIRRLEREGLVEREGDRRDTRGTWVRLTSAGLDVAQRFYDLGDRLAAQVLAEWDPEDVRTYTRLMERFTRSAVEQAHAVRRHGLDAVPPLPEREEQASPHGPRVEP
jgi:DNA-binding MarR family transcriptional regulator